MTSLHYSPPGGWRKGYILHTIPASPPPPHEIISTIRIQDLKGVKGKQIICRKKKVEYKDTTQVIKRKEVTNTFLQLPNHRLSSSLPTEPTT